MVYLRVTFLLPSFLCSDLIISPDLSLSSVMFIFCQCSTIFDNFSIYLATLDSLPKFSIYQSILKIIFYSIFFQFFWFSLHEKTSFSHFFLFLPHGFLWFLTDLRHCTLESLPIKNMPFHLKFLPPDTCQAFLYSYTYHFIQN